MSRRPRVARQAPDPGGAGGPTRQRGWVGLVVAILGSLVLSAALTGLADGTHWLWVVRP